jgi:hypothetical protein
VFDGSEDVLDCSSPDGHGFGLSVQPTLHGLEYMFVFPPSDAAIVAGRTSVFQVATRTSAGPVHPQIHVILNGVEPMNGTFAGRAAIHIVSCDVDEVALGKETFLDAEVSGLGTYGVMPASSHARISGPLK